MTHLKAINRKATRVVDEVRGAKEGDVVALQQPPGPHFPLGCSLAFSAWGEADSMAALRVCSR